MSDKIRMPAEWEPVDAVIVAWPHEDTDWCDMLPEIRATYGKMIAAIAERAKVIVIGPEQPDAKYFPEGTATGNISYHRMPTNDTWTRDYGPITIEKNGVLCLCDFQFNGWGLKFAANKDNLATMRLCDAEVLTLPRINRLGFTLEGGAIESDGAGFILTTASVQLSPNRNGDLSRPEIDALMKEYLGAHTVAWLYNGELEGDDTDGHIDTLARIVPPGDTIMYVACSDPTDGHHEPLRRMKEELQALRRADGMPFNLVELPMPDPIYDPADGTRLPATYANFLIVNGAVIMPVYNQPLKDRHAVMAVQAAMPEYEIVPVDCCALVRQHGSLHCATMQIPSQKCK